MEWVWAPKQSDGMVITNMFGNILSDHAAMLAGSIVMLLSASLDAAGKEGMNRSIVAAIAKPLVTLLLVAKMMHYTFAKPTR